MAMAHSISTIDLLTFNISAMGCTLAPSLLDFRLREGAIRRQRCGFARWFAGMCGGSGMAKR